MGQEIIKRVDHVLVRVTPPEPLFAILRDQLLLPEAWPLTTNAFYTSGGVHLGNMNLEVMQLNQDAAKDAADKKYPARLFGLAFELHPYDKSLPELDRRGIPHTPPVPFYQFDEQGWQVTSWTNVYLGGLFHGGPLARTFFQFSRSASGSAWERAALPTAFNRRFGLPFIFNHVYTHGMTFSSEYNPAWKGINICPEPDRSGLDVKQVSEITFGSSDFLRARARWQNLLAPHPEVAEAVWLLPDNLRLRLKPAAKDGLLHMVWQVHSLNRTAQFLHRRGMLGKEIKGMLRIDPDKVMGLDIRLIQ